MKHWRTTQGYQHLGATLLGVVLTTPAVVWACPTCKDAIDTDPVATALSATTLLLLAMPALLIGSIGGWVCYVYWRAARRPVANATAPQPSGIAEPV